MPVVRTEFPREVELLEYERIPLPDGVHLIARVWLPKGAAAEPVPAILEAVPYRFSDGTAAETPASTGTSPGTATPACASTCAAPASPRAS
jgi:predicted acyl esterase